MGKPKGDKRNPTEEPWDGPYFNEQYGLWFRQRADINEPGGIKFEWIGPELPVQGQPDPQIPRSQVADLSDDFGNLNLDNSSGYDTSGAPLVEAQSSYTWQDSDVLGKGKALADTTYSTGSYGDSYNVEGDYSADVDSIAPTYDLNASAYDQYAPGASVQDTYRESEQAARRFQEQPGPSSTAQSASAPVLEVPLLGGSSKDTIPLTPRRGDHYRVERSSKWTKGEVIKCWHAEPRGGQDHEQPLTEKTERNQPDSLERFYVGPRRFIIVKTSHGRSTCVPISTYSGHGLSKSGITPGTHSIVYSSSSKPLLLQTEPEPGYPPIPVDMTGNENLTMLSRVDYSNLKTIEHNVPVIFIGTVPKRAQPIVTQGVDECWADDQSAAAGSSRVRSKQKPRKRH